MAGLTTLTATFTDSANINGALAAAGLSSGPGSQNQETTSYQYGKQAANAASLGADEGYFSLLTIPANGSLDIDLRALAVDVAGQTAVLARLKAFRFHLLAAAQTAPDGTTTGTACSGVTIGNAGSNGHALNLGAQAHTVVVGNGGIHSYKDFTGGGLVVDATHKVIHIVNNDTLVDGKLLVALAGATT